MRALALVAFLLACGCASLPRTSLPICSGISDEVCISSVAAERDYKWEAVNTCPRPPEKAHGPCYAFAGARDSRQVYRYILAHAEPPYLPKLTHLSLKECLKRFPRKEVGGYCEWYGGADISDECQPGYHRERQWATEGFGAALIPTSRLVCHRDVLRGEATIKGLECAHR